MKLISLILIGVLVWDFVTAPPGQSVTERAYQAAIHSSWFQALTTREQAAQEQQAARQPMSADPAKRAYAP